MTWNRYNTLGLIDITHRHKYNLFLLQSSFIMLRFQRSGRKSDLLRPWETRTHCCGHIVPHDISWAAQTGKHLSRTQNVSGQNRKHFLCSRHKICVCNKFCTRANGETFVSAQCVRNNLSSFARAFRIFFTSRHCLTQVVTAPISNGKTRTTQADASVKNSQNCCLKTKP